MTLSDPSDNESLFNIFGRGLIHMGQFEIPLMPSGLFEIDPDYNLQPITGFASDPYWQLDILDCIIPKQTLFDYDGNGDLMPMET